jgi:hypothetical protein
MSRPLIREPDLINRWKAGDHRKAECNSDNLLVRHVAVTDARKVHRDDMEFVGQCRNEVAVLMRRGWEAMQQNERGFARLARFTVEDVQPFDLSGSHPHISFSDIGCMVHMPLLDFVSAMVKLFSEVRGRCGFSVHADNQIARDDRDGQKALAEYILRNAFSEQKITTIEDTGTVIYRSGMTHGSNKKNFEVFSAEEFIAAITQHIPDKSFQMVRYYGWYSNRGRGERIKAEPMMAGDEPTSPAATPQVEVLDVSDYKRPRIPSKTWRELIKKIWEVDPLSCPRCAHEMKIISLINEPDVIEHILRHLGLWRQHPDLHETKTKAPPDGPVVFEDYDDGWPGYEEPVIIYH